MKLKPNWGKFFCSGTNVKAFTCVTEYAANYGRSIKFYPFENNLEGEYIIKYKEKQFITLCSVNKIEAVLVRLMSR